MAGSQKEFELLFRLKASLGNNFNKTFKSAIETQKQLQNSLKSVNSLQGKVDGYTKTSNAIEQQKNKLASLQGAHERISQRLQAHKDSVSRLADAIEKTGDSTGVLTAQLEAEKREVQKYSDSLRTNNSQIRQTTANIERNEQALKEQGNELREAGVNTDNLEEANGRLKKSYERLQSSQQTYQRLNQTQQNIGKSISHTKAQLAGTVGAMAAAGAAIYNGPVKKAAEFEQQMSTVKSLIGDVGKKELSAVIKTADKMGISFKEGSNNAGTAMNILAAKAKDMGAKTKFTAKEAGEAMQFMAVAGWNTSEVLGGISGVMNLAAASNADLGTTSDIVTDSIENFGLTAKDAQHFVDVMAQTARKSNTDVLKLGESYKYVSPVAKAMGYSVEDINVALGLMANSGIKASAGGTALRTLLTNMAKPTEAMQGAMEKLGVSLDDGHGNMKTFAEVMKDLRSGFGKLQISPKECKKALSELNAGLEKGEVTQKQYDKSLQDLTKRAFGAEGAIKAEAAATLAGKEGMSGLLAIINASDKTFKDLTNDINNADGTAEEMAKIQLDNFNGQITLMQSAWDALQTELGTLLLPTLTKIIKTVTDVMGVVTDFVKKNPETVKMIAKVVAGLMAFRVGMLSLKLASLTGAGGIVSLLQKLIGLRTGLLESAATGQGFAAKLAGGFAGLAGKLGGVLTGAGSKLLLILLKPFGSLGGMLGRALSKVGGVILNSPLGSIGKVFVSSFGKLGALLTPIGNVISKVLGPIGKIGSTLLGPLGGIAGKFLPIIGIITTIIAVVQMLRKNFDKVREAVGNVFGEKGLEIFDKIVAVITNVGETIKGVFSDGNIGAARDKINEIFGEKGVAVFDTFAGVFQKIITAAGQFVGFVTTHIVPVVEQVLGVLVTSVIPGIINGIKVAAPVVMQIFQAIADFIAGIMPIISEVITFIQTYVFPIISEVFNFIVSTVLPFIVQGIQQLGSIITTVLSAVLPVVQTVFSTIWSIIQPILAQVLSTVQAVLPAVLSIFQSVFNAIGGVISAARQIFNGLIQFITGVFTGNWSAAWEGIKSIFSGIWNGIKSICAGVINGIIGAVNVVIRGLNSLKIPDWVPGIGGKGINIPEIPKFAKGTKKTPQTFIAGEKGPELITNAPGRTVYTAQQTRDIFNTSNEPESVPELRSGSGQKSISITINYNPVIHVDGGKPGDLEEKLEENNRRLLQQVKDMLDKRDDDTRRSVYA